MRILVTGNLGYVGSVVVPHLRSRFPNSDLIGFDTGFYSTCHTTIGRASETQLTTQRFGDIRELQSDMLEGVDVIIHLAAISNDPIGNRFETVTDEINRGASLRLAGMAQAAGVHHFVFASSCSVYGAAGHEARRETDSLNPLTAYARSKVITERALAEMNQSRMVTTCLRFATACGMSGRLRLDLVLNDFVACALSTGNITILSDGTPWRPLIDVRDMARAIEWAALRPSEAGGNTLVVNVGSEHCNYQVRDLAQAVAAAVHGSSISIGAAAQPDARSYQVDFTLYKQLAPDYLPQSSLQMSIKSLVKGLLEIGFDEPDFRDSRKLIRLNAIASLIEARELDSELRWLQTHTAE